jgi:hypothetical protein
MFGTFQIDDKIFEEIIINTFNFLFEYLQDFPIKSYSDLVDQKTLLNLCLEMDEANFKIFESSLLFERNFGIFFAEIKEIINKIIEVLRTSGISFKNTFYKDFENFNLNSLIKNDLIELKRLINLIILFLFNCVEKEKFIDKIVLFEEFQQQELLKIVERYMIIEENRESVMPKSKKVSNRNTVNAFENNFMDSDVTQKFLSRIDLLEKERETFEKEKIQITLKINELETEKENIKKENANLMNELKKMKENYNKSENENKEIKKTIYEQKLRLEELDDTIKEGKLTASYKIKLDDKDAEISLLKNELKGLNENHSFEIKEYKERIEIMQEKISTLNEVNLKFQKMKEMLKDYDAIKEKAYLLESSDKELNKMKKDYKNIKEEKDNLENLVTELEKKLEENIINYRKMKKGEEKEDESNYVQLLRAKEDYIKQLEIKISKLEILKSENLRLKEEKQKELNSFNNDMKNNIMYYLDKINSLEKELETKINNNESLKKKDEEIELLKKEILEIKDRYEKEFELISSSLYNLGLNYWSMKLEYTQKLSEKPTWLVKERQKYFNGDF